MSTIPFLNCDCSRLLFVVLQSRFKSVLAVRDYNQKKKAVTIIQRHYRARLAMKREQKAYSVLRDCMRVTAAFCLRNSDLSLLALILALQIS
jgi:hypothetical protein